MGTVLQSVSILQKQYRDKNGLNMTADGGESLSYVSRKTVSPSVRRGYKKRLNETQDNITVGDQSSFQQQKVRNDL